MVAIVFSLRPLVFQCTSGLVVSPTRSHTVFLGVLAGCLFVGVVSALIRLRKYFIERKIRSQLSERRRERERTTRELHDALLQSLQGLLLRFETATRKIPKGTQAREMMESALNRADEVLIEGRNRVTALHSNSGTTENRFSGSPFWHQWLKRFLCSPLADPLDLRAGFVKERMNPSSIPMAESLSSETTSAQSNAGFVMSGEWGTGENAMTEESILNTDGQEIFFRSWQPSEDSRGTIVIIPGFNAHSGYYGWAADQFNAENLAVYAIDLRGRGKSEGERFYVESFEDYVHDVEGLMNLVKVREGAKPVIMLGHSAGGVVACLYTLDHPTELTGLISESFAHELPAPDFVLSVFKGLSYILPHTQLLQLKNEKFSRNPQAVAVMDADPLIENEKQPAQTMAALVRAEERLKNEFVLITTPILILHGTADENARPSGSQHFYDQVGSPDKTLKLYEGGFHDLLNDTDKELVISDMKVWINRHLPNAPSRIL